MHKMSNSLAAVTLLVVITTAACSSSAPIPQQPASGSVSQPVAVVQTAPQCKTPTTCQAPVGELHKIDCVNKIPYTNVLVPAGTAFEVLDKSGDFKCSDSGQVVEGKTVLSCYGKELNAFDLKLTSTNCSRVALTEGTGQCQPGFGYDAAQQCCAPTTTDDAGSTSMRVELGACPLPQIHTP